VLIYNTSGLLLYLQVTLSLLNHPDQNAISSGQSKYQELALKSSLPKYGSCWMAALSNLASTCNELSDDSQARLALKFANCFLAQAGQPKYPCEDYQEMSECLRNADSNAFTAYSNFFTHTQNMCYFLKSIEWQELTDDTINRLSVSSAKVAEELEVSANLQQEIYQGQQETLKYERELSLSIEASKGNVRDMLEEFKLSTSEQKHMIFEVFDRVTTLQNLVVSEVSWLYTVVFYSACLLVIYLVTSTKRTVDARLWMFFILSVNFCMERLVMSYSLPSEGDNLSLNFSQILSDRIWLVRNAAIFSSILVLLFKAINYKDMNLVNNRLLEEIKKQNLEMRKSMESYQVANRTESMISNIDAHDGHLLNPRISAMLEEDTGFVGDEEVDSDSDSDSFNTTKTDRTFTPCSFDNSFSDEEFGTAKTSRESTPPRNPIDKALEALSNSIIHSTPAKYFAMEESQQQPSPSRYNLRPRSASKAKLNSTLQESPETFAKEVKTQLSRSKRNFSKWKMAVGKEELCRVKEYLEENDV